MVGGAAAAAAAAGGWQGARPLATALAVCLVIAVAAMVGVSVARPRASAAVLFDDPVSRGVYGEEKGG